LSATQWGYDETTPIATSGIIQHVAAPGARRNLTSTHNWISGNTYLTSTTSYYDTGAAYSTTSPNGTTTYSFDSTQTFVGNTQYPTPTSGASIATSAAFNVTSGIQTSATGLNAGQTVTYGQYDRLLRPTQITTPTSDGGETNITYSPQQVSVLTRMSTSQTADQETFLDAYGRTKRIAIRADLPTIPGQPTPPTQWYITDSCYDAAGRLEYQSVPYESGSNNPSSYQCSTGTGTYYQYDALNRTTFVSHADGSSISFSYLGRAVRSTTSTTPAISRITQYDPLGRIAAVCELSSNATMPNSGSPGACYYFPSGSSSTSSTPMDLAGSGFTTTYSYNGASTTITQGAQSRVFQLDGVGRTVYASEPESGITTYSYTYNSVGLVIIRVRPTANVSSNPSPNPLPTTTTFTDYDSLGRLLGSGSTDGTPERTFSYDTYSGIGAQGYSLGQMTSATVGNTSLPTDQETFYYDIMGRPHETVECFPGWCSAGNTAVRWYGYNFASQLIQEQYGTVLGGGSPATIDYGWGLAGQVSSISGGQSGGSIYTAQSMLPSGPTLVQLGNGLYTPYRYSTAGGLSAGSVCSGSQQVGCTGGQQLYGFSDTVSGMHVTSSADSVLGQQLTYGYDEFGRLTGVSTVANSSSNGVVIGMSFGYDRWGNRATQAMTQGSGPQPSYAFSAATNQITSYSYDVAGNVISDGINNYTYDADNNLTAISGGTTASFFYNALGQRTMATINGVTERYNYNLQGQRATSWNSSGTIDSAQYYAGGGQVGYWSATDSNMHYQHRDFVGTVRARTNAAGSLESTSYSLPYGDALSVSGSDTDPQHFALLDHDGGASSGLEHAAYREYHATSGRWLSPDPYSGSYSLSSPQSMNRYVYALNNPLTMVDPLGLDAEPCETSAEVRSGGATSHDATDTEPGDCSPGDTGDGGDPDAPPSYTLQVNVYEYSTVIYLPWSGNLFLGSSAGSGPDGSTVVAPNNGMPKTPQQCAGEALKKNAVALTLDVAGVGAGFLPGGDLVVAGVQAGISVGSGVNSAVHGDAIGSGLGVLGLPATFTSYAAKAIGVGGKALPGVGAFISGLGALNDAYGTYQDYQACLAGH
jgi:RHS repeat-associated protein